MDISLRFMALGILLGLSLHIYRFIKKRDVSKKELTISPIFEMTNGQKNVDMKNNHKNIPLILVASKQPTVVAPQPISIKEGELLSKYENCYFNVLTWIDELKITADGRYLLSRDEQINGNKQIIKIWDIEQNRVVKIYENIENLPPKEQKFLDSFGKYLDISIMIDFYYDVWNIEIIDNENRWVHSFFYPNISIFNDIYLSESREGFRRYMFFSDDEKGEIFIKPVAYSFAPLPFDESQSSKYIFSKSYEESLEIWKREKKRLKSVELLHDKNISCVAISRDKKYMVSGAYSCYSDRYSCLNLWDLEKGELVKNFKEAQDIHSVCFSYDGEYIITGSGSACDQSSCYLQVWNREGLTYSIEDRDYIPVVSSFESVGISVDGNYIFSFSSEKEEKNVWNIGTIEDFKVLSGTVQEVQAVTVSEDKRYLMSVSQENIVSVWDREAKILYRHHELTKEMNMEKSYEDDQECISISKDGSSIEVRSVEHGNLLQEYIVGKEGNWMIRDFEAQKVYKGDNGEFLFEKKEVWREGESVVFEINDVSSQHEEYLPKTAQRKAKVEEIELVAYKHQLDLKRDELKDKGYVHSHESILKQALKKYEERILPLYGDERDHEVWREVKSRQKEMLEKEKSIDNK